MLSENSYYIQAFQAVRGAGYRYDGSGSYQKDGGRVRVRTFEEWQAEPKLGYFASQAR